MVTMWPCASWLQLAKTVMRSSSHTHYTATFVIRHAFGTLSLRAFKSGLCFAYPAFHNLKTNRRGRCSLVKMFTRRARDKTHGRQWHHALGRPPGFFVFRLSAPAKKRFAQSPFCPRFGLHANPCKNIPPLHRRSVGQRTRQSGLPQKHSPTALLDLALRPPSTCGRFACKGLLIRSWFKWIVLRAFAPKQSAIYPT